MISKEQRMAKLKKGPGVFSYNGNAFDTESIPGEINYAIVKNLSEITDEVLSNPRSYVVQPKVIRKQLGSVKVQGIVFNKGDKVSVDSIDLAFKLRAMGCFDEHEEKAEDTASGGDGDLSVKTKAELLEIAESRGLDVSGVKTKAELLELLGA